jgi:hypothetical protein
MSEILTAALEQNPIEFQVKFDEAVKAAILASGATVKAEILKPFQEAKGENPFADKKDKEDGDDKDDKDDKKDDKSDDKKDESDKKDDEDKDDKEDKDSKKSDLTERTLSFEVGNPATASKQLRSKGIAAASEPGDGKVVKVKVATPEDGRKISAWLQDQGWSEKEVHQKYPELSRLTKGK